MNSKKSSLLVVILIFVSAFKLYSQTKAIKGRVVDEDCRTIPYASIMLNDSVKLGQTDIDGYFKIDIPADVKNISITYVGFEKALLKLVDNCNSVEVVMLLHSTYDFMTFKKIDRLRMKRFKQLPTIHKLAFEKGIFTTNKACYTQAFIPVNKKNQR